MRRRGSIDPGRGSRGGRGAESGARRDACILLLVRPRRGRLLRGPQQPGHTGRAVSDLGNDAFASLLDSRPARCRAPGRFRSITFGRGARLACPLRTRLGDHCDGLGQAPWKQVDRLLTSVDGPTAFAIEPAVDFIEPRTDSGEKVAFICRDGYLMAERAGVRNVSPIADPQALVGDAQVGEVVDALRAEGGNKVFSCQIPSFPLPSEIEAGLAARGLTKSDTDEAVGITEWTFSPTN